MNTSLKSQNKTLKIVVGILLICLAFVLGYVFHSPTNYSAKPLANTPVKASEYGRPVNYHRRLIVKNIVTNDTHGAMTKPENHKVALYIHHIKNLKHYRLSHFSSDVSAGNGDTALCNTLVLVRK